MLGAFYFQNFVGPCPYLLYDISAGTYLRSRNINQSLFCVCYHFVSRNIVWTRQTWLSLSKTGAQGSEEFRKLELTLSKLLFITLGELTLLLTKLFYLCCSFPVLVLGKSISLWVWKQTTPYPQSSWHYYLLMSNCLPWGQ